MTASPILIAAIIAVAVLSRPVEAYLWRRGRLSDQAFTLLLVARFPVLAVIFLVLSAASLPTILLILPGAMVVPLVSYRFVLGQVQDARRDAAAITSPAD